MAALLALAGCSGAPRPAAEDPGVDLSDPNVGGGAGEATGPQTPVPTASPTREGSPRLDGTATLALPAATLPPTITPTPPAATAAPEQATAAPDQPTAAPTEPPPTAAPPDTPTPPVPTATPAPDGERTHVVQAGENLYRIGLQYGLSWVAIAEYNGITDPNAITVGQELRIPPSPTPTATATTAAAPVAPVVVAEVEPAATAEQAVVPAPADPPAAEPDETAAPLESAAPANVHTVAAGDTLYGIARRYGVEWTQVAEANGLATPNQVYPGQMLKIPPDVPGPTPTLAHQVHRGDTLFGLARQYGQPLAALAEANNLQAPYVLYPGQVLVIPSDE
jgi:LysM repeat protein